MATETDQVTTEVEEQITIVEVGSDDLIVSVPMPEESPFDMAMSREAIMARRADGTEEVVYNPFQMDQKMAVFKGDPDHIEALLTVALQCVQAARVQRAGEMASPSHGSGPS